MPQRIRITGGKDIGGLDSEGRDVQVDEWGSLHIRDSSYNFDNKTYEGTVTAANSPVTCSFYSDTGRDAFEGWIVNDGAGDIQVDFSRDGLSYGDKFTIKKGEFIDLLRLRINKLRLTRVTADAGYRVFLI